MPLYESLFRSKARAKRGRIVAVASAQCDQIWQNSPSLAIWQQGQVKSGQVSNIDVMRNVKSCG